MKLYFLRHSQTDYNLEHRHDHEGKATLTDLGKSRAETLIEIFADKSISHIYSSPLQRCIDTISPTAQKLGKEIKTDERLREIFFGPLQDKYWNNFNKDFLTDIHNIKSPTRRKGYEHMSEVYERTSDFIESLREQYTDAEIIICSHGSPLINLISYVDNVPVDCSHEAVPKNTGTTDEDAYILREI